MREHFGTRRKKKKKNQNTNEHYVICYVWLSWLVFVLLTIFIKTKTSHSNENEIGRNLYKTIKHDNIFGTMNTAICDVLFFNVLLYFLFVTLKIWNISAICLVFFVFVLIREVFFEWETVKMTILQLMSYIYSAMHRSKFSNFMSMHKKGIIIIVNHSSAISISKLDLINIVIII